MTPSPSSLRLEKAEHERELALREELIRQEKLEQLAARFDRKAGMRETWLSENQRLVSQVSLTHSLTGLYTVFHCSVAGRLSNVEYRSVMEFRRCVPPADGCIIDEVVMRAITAVGTVPWDGMAPLCLVDRVLNGPDGPANSANYESHAQRVTPKEMLGGYPLLTKC